MANPPEMIKCTTVILQVPTTTLSSYRLAIIIPMVESGRKQHWRLKGFPSRNYGKVKAPSMRREGGKLLNQKSDGFPFLRLNDFESRNGGREKAEDMRRGRENFGRKSEGFDIGREMAFSAATTEEKKLRVRD